MAVIIFAELPTTWLKMRRFDLATVFRMDCVSARLYKLNTRDADDIIVMGPPYSTKLHGTWYRTRTPHTRHATASYEDGIGKAGISQIQGDLSLDQHLTT